MSNLPNLPDTPPPSFPPPFSPPDSQAGFSDHILPVTSLPPKAAPGVMRSLQMQQQQSMSNLLLSRGLTPPKIPPSPASKLPAGAVGLPGFGRMPTKESTNEMNEEMDLPPPMPKNSPPLPDSPPPLLSMSSGDMLPPDMPPPPMPDDMPPPPMMDEMPPPSMSPMPPDIDDDPKGLRRPSIESVSSRDREKDRERENPTPILPSALKSGVQMLHIPVGALKKRPGGVPRPYEASDDTSTRSNNHKDPSAAIMQRPMRKGGKTSHALANAFSDEFTSIQVVRPLDIKGGSSTLGAAVTASKPSIDLSIDKQESLDDSEDDLPTETRLKITSDGMVSGELEVRYQGESDWVNSLVRIIGSNICVKLPLENVPEIEVDLRRARIRRNSLNGDPCFQIESANDSLLFRAVSAAHRSDWMEQLLTAVTQQPQTITVDKKAAKADADDINSPKTTGRSDEMQESPIVDDDSFPAAQTALSKQKSHKATIPTISPSFTKFGSALKTFSPRNRTQKPKNEVEEEDEGTVSGWSEEEDEEDDEYEDEDEEEDEEEDERRRKKSPKKQKQKQKQKTSPKTKHVNLGGAHAPMRPSSAQLNHSQAVDARDGYTESLGIQTDVATTKMVGGHDRDELMQTHIAKPRLSIRKLKLYVNWINSLQIWPQEVDILSLHRHLCNGLLLCRAMKQLTRVELIGVNERPLTRKPAVDNLELALSVIWKSTGVHNSRIPTASDVYEGNTAKIAILMMEMFEGFVLRDLMSVAPTLLSWYDNILRQYGRALPLECLHDPMTSLWEDFQSATSLFCVIYHFTGSTTVGKGPTAVKVDSLRISKRPRNIREFRENLSYVFELMKALEVEIVWTVDDWLSSPDQQFLLLQLRNLYLRFRKKQCALPPAQGTIAGVTSGPNGEPMVTGLMFADSETNAFQRRKKNVLLGDNMSGLPVIPIWTNLKESPYLPPGLTNSTLPIRQLSDLDIISRTGPTKIDANATGWNMSAAVARISQDEQRVHSTQLEANKVVLIDLAEREKDRLLKALQDAGFATSGLKDDDVASAWASLRNIKALEQELDDHVKQFNLEKAEADAIVEKKELELEQRYAALEQQAGGISEGAYDARLEELERRRRALEEERTRMEERFEAKMKSLEEQREELKNKAKFVAIKEQFVSQRASIVSTNPNANASPIKPAATLRKPQADQAKQKTMERGWNRFAQTASTHNQQLKSLQNESFSNLQKSKLGNDKMNATEDAYANLDDWQKFCVKIQDSQEKWFMEKEQRNQSRLEQLQKEGRFSPRMPIAKRSSPSTQEPNPQNEFAEVKRLIRLEELDMMQREEERAYRLMRQSSRRAMTQAPQAQPKAAPRQILLMSPRDEDMEEEPGQRKSSSLTLAPTSVTASKMTAQAPTNTANVINLPTAGDKLGPKQPLLSRGTSIQSKSNQPVKEGPLSQPVPRLQAQASTTSQSSSSLSSVDVLQKMMKTGTVSGTATQFSGVDLTGLGPDEIAAYMRWLSAPKIARMKDRNSEKEYEFTVVQGSSVTDDVERRDAYALKWSVSAAPTRVVGFVSFSDIQSITLSELDGCIVNVNIKQRVPAALKNSEGRTVVSVKFGSPAEAGKYKSIIQVIVSL